MANILLVDDDRDMLNLCRSVLASANHNVWSAETVVQALEILKTNSIELIITDANMKPYTGFELLRTLRNERSFRNTPIIMLTSRREKQDIQRAIQLGVSDYMIKPLDADLLIEKVASNLKAHGVPVMETKNVPENDISVRCEMIIPATVKSISEKGVVLSCVHSVETGFRFRIDSMLFQELGITAPVVHVLSSLKRGDSFEVRVVFIGMDERSQLKIRSWMSSQSLKRAA